MSEKTILCMASAYKQKYYFNEKFKSIPQSIQEELRILCVLFTEEVGGEFSLVFDEEGTLLLETAASEDDYYYDEIGSGLLVKKVQEKREELLESLSLYYRTVVLNQELPEEM